MTNDMKQVGSEFFRSLGNGKAAVGLLVTLVDEVVRTSDATRVAQLLARAEKEKGDTAVVKSVQRVMKAIFVDCKISKGKIIVKGCTVDSDALSRLVAAGEKGLSIRGSAFLKLVEGEDGSAKKSPIDVLKAAIEQAKKGGVTMEQAAMLVGEVYA